jgi:hypothetical protein
MLITSHRPHVPRLTSRREFLFKAGGGFGALALAYLLQQDGALSGAETAATRASPLTVRPPHFATRAQSVIFLFM